MFIRKKVRGQNLASDHEIFAEPKAEKATLVRKKQARVCSAGAEVGRGTCLLQI